MTYATFSAPREGATECGTVDLYTSAGTDCATEGSLREGLRAGYALSPMVGRAPNSTPGVRGARPGREQ